MKNLTEKIKDLDTKFGIELDNINVATPVRDGLLDKKEAGAMFNGFLGGKGQLENGTNFDDIKTGGIYLLQPDSTYVNDPSEDFKAIFGGAPFRASLTVIRNYGVVPTTPNPIVYQKWEMTTFTGNNFYADRLFLSGAWSAWSYPLGKPLFFGSVNMNTKTISLNQSILDFNSFEVRWRPSGGGTMIERAQTNRGGTSFCSINIPDNFSGIETPAVAFEELRVYFSADGLTATIGYSNVLMVGNSTKPNNTSELLAATTIDMITGISRR